MAMAGLGTILAHRCFAVYPGRIVNTHPSLLPAFPGWNAVREALAYGVKVTGCTVHVATEQVDTGPILAQEAVAVLPDDDEATLHERIKTVERRLYVETIRSTSSSRRPRMPRAHPQGPLTDRARPAVRLRQDRYGRAWRGRCVDLGWELVSSRGTAACHRRRRPAGGRRGQVTGSPRCSGTGWSPCTPIHGGILADRSDPDHLADLDGPRHHPDRPRGGQPLPVHLRPRRSSSSTSAARRWCGRGQEPRARGRRGRAVATTTRCSTSCGPGRRSATTLAAAWPGTAFAHTAAYDAAIVAWFDEEARPDVLPPSLHLAAPSGPGPALRREPPPGRRPLPLAGERAAGTTPSSTGARSCPTSTSTTPTRPGAWSTSLGERPGRRGHQARQPLRGGGGRRPHHRLHPGPRVRPGVGLRRHRRASTAPSPVTLAEALAPSSPRWSSPRPSTTAPWRC